MATWRHLYAFEHVCKHWYQCISIVHDKSNTNGEVLLMDASKLGKKIKVGKNQKTVLSKEELDKIVDIFVKHIIDEDFSVLVTYDQIKEKNYSFSAGQYFDVKIEYVELTPEEFEDKMNT